MGQLNHNDKIGQLFGYQSPWW